MWLPAFPLNLLPLPGELLPLHIFEPRYRQLLSDAEEKDIEFVIAPLSPENPNGYGCILKLEQVIRRLPTGESDIIVRGQDFCRILDLKTVFREKLYPAALVQRQNCDLSKMAGISLILEYSEWQKQINKTAQGQILSVHQIATSLQLNLNDRIRFAKMSEQAREKFLIKRIIYEKRIAKIALDSKRIYHLN